MSAKIELSSSHQEKNVKVSDLKRTLSHFNDEDEIVLKHIDGRDWVINQCIRVYTRDARVIIDGYNREV